MATPAFKTSVVSRETLKKKVQQAMEIVAEGTIFVAGVRKVKDYEGEHQMMLEIVQLKNLRQGEQKVNMLAQLNIGDKRFTNSNRTVRVWVKMTKGGYEVTFPQLASQISGEELHKRVGELKDEEILSFFTAFNQISLKGIDEPVKPTIQVKQYSQPDELPARISKILDVTESERTEQQEAELEGFMMRSNEGEELVDESGNQVYEMNMFTYGEEENTVIRKMPISEYKKLLTKKSSTNTSTSKVGVGQIEGLIE